MIKRKNIISVLVVLVGLAGIFSVSCNNDPGFPAEPSLEFLSLTPDTVQDQRDSMVLRLRFTDGDGNLGSDDNGVFNLVVVDRRLYADEFPLTEEQATLNYTLPDLTPDTKNPAIQGIINVEIAPTAIRLALQGASQDVTTFDVFITDRDDNVSNTITTTPVVIVR
ncbi:MAG: hypothetical protein AAGC85_02850 [Bacteroidota bacterium]